MDITTVNTCIQQHNCRRRHEGYILVVVLGFVAVATSLGLAFLDANSTVMPEAVNYKGIARAQYLAGSGVALASHYLMYPPTTVPYGSYWTGANNIGVDSSADYCNVSVARSDAWSPPKSDPNLYRITSVGVALDPNGSVRARKTSTAEVLIPLTQKWQLPYAYLASGAFNIPSISRINGDAHSNSSLNGTGYCNGRLSAGLTCSWFGTGPPISLTSGAPVISPLPTTTAANYSTYTILGRTYTAYTGFTNNTMTQSDANALNAIDMSATNPGRIIIAPAGEFRVRANVNLTGTLVVTGKLRFDDSGTHTITAVPYFPAAVVSDDIKVNNDDEVINFVGPVICAGRFDNNSKDRTSLNVTGPWIVATNATGIKTTCVLTYNYSQSRSVFWDFQSAIAPKPITTLSWKEN